MKAPVSVYSPEIYFSPTKKRTLERQKTGEQAVHQVLVNRGFLESKPWAILAVRSTVGVKTLNKHILSLPKKKKKANQLPYETEETTAVTPPPAPYLWPH